MGYLVGTVLLLVGGVGLILVGALMRGSEDRVDKTAGGWMMVASLVVAVIISVWTALASAHSIEAGNVGVVYQFGSIKGQITEGFNWVAPWRSVRVANIQVQRHVFEKLDAFSEETQDVFVKATLNVRVSTETIQELYRSVGPNWFQVLVESRVAQNFKDETVKYKSVEIAPSREKIRQTVRDRLEHELSPYSIEVVDLLLDNIDFRPEFKAAIEAKQNATQKALEEQQRVKVAEYQAEQRVKTAEGEGLAILAVASKQAEANLKLSASLTPELIQYALVQKLGDNIEVIILPAGQNFILDSDVLKGTVKEEGK
jgi:regulator of protease activity HflC (stomatin/prohibitin superfamily)